MDNIRKNGWVPLYTQPQFNAQLLLLDPRLSEEEKEAEKNRLYHISNPDRYKVTEAERL
jgi:hypothetical protein